MEIECSSVIKWRLPKNILTKEKYPYEQYTDFHGKKESQEHTNPETISEKLEILWAGE